MIIQDPMEFFKTPEQVVIINIVDIINKFTIMIEDYIIELEPAYIKNTGTEVILKKSDKFTDKNNEQVDFNTFLKLTGDYFINDNIVQLNANTSRKNYRLRTKSNIVTDILIAFIKDDISKRSNWETVHDVYEVIADYISPNHNVEDVCNYITERIDPFIRSLITHYHGKDWNIHEVEYDGFYITLKRYGDWRAYKWNVEQYAKQLEAEHTD